MVVSIPNGMEFYKIFKHEWHASDSFNSQRDGILRFISPPSKTCRIVSIPNGMEFYAFFHKLAAIKSSVSIPNGMEFYYMEVYHYVRVHKFQFPTGWNSTAPARKNLNQIIVVSIPNGMEFYSTNFAIFLGRKC